MENEKIVKLKDEEKPQDNPKPEDTKTEPGKFKKALLTVTKPVRWAWGKVKNSPAATAIGMVGGGALALGGRVLIKKYLGDRMSEDEPDQIEGEDLGETYVDSEEDQAV